MKNSKTLIILLVVPFIISLLTFASVRIMENIVEADIVDIVWNYNDNEGFKLGSQLHKLEAEVVVSKDIQIDPEAKELVWSVQKIKNTDPEVLQVIEDGDDFLLRTIQEGQAKVVCSNKRGSLSKFFTATVYKDGAIIINNKTYPTSGGSVTGERYFGEYDFVYDQVKLNTYTTAKPTFKLDVQVLGANEPDVSFITSDNIVMDNSYNVTILKEGRSNITFKTIVDGANVTGIYSFEVIDNGFNIYNYNDLLMATNFSSEGLPVVLQTSLLSLSQTYVYDDVSEKYINVKLENAKNAKLFGNFDFSKQKFSFEKELFLAESTYNTEFIKQYNLAKGEKNSTQIKAGIHLQKNLYGNGFTINQHALAYPNHGTYPASHKGRLVPTKGLDYFFGPLSYVSIGNLEEMPVVKAYGQDNVGVYVDGDNIRIEDVKLRNTDEISNMVNLTYTGTVVDVNGKNVQINNSILSNGRTVVRAFSADGLRINNSILKNSNEFLLKLGSNRYNKADHSKTVSQIEGGEYIDYEFDQFMNTTSSGSNLETVLNSFVETTAINDANVLKQTKYNLTSIQSALDNTDGIIDEEGNVIYDSEIDLSKTYFYNSGLFSIAFDTLFNGAYLYNASPSVIRNYAGLFTSVNPNEIGGTSYPVKLNIDSKCIFYDWKNIDSIDVSTLIEENISALLTEVSGKEIDIGIDDFFPMKELLIKLAKEKGYIYTKDGVDYINSKIAFYGGGLNLSTIEYGEGAQNALNLSDEINVDILELLLTSNSALDTSNAVFRAFRKAVTLASGFHPFKFYTNSIVGNSVPSDFGKNPQVEDLYSNLEA